jgi:hypothetical protein
LKSLGLLDISVERNTLGRQKDSFEADLPIRGLEAPFHAVFIRAPVISRVDEGVEILSKMDGAPVAVRRRRHLGLSSHPELSGNTRLHRMFLDRLSSSSTSLFWRIKVSKSEKDSIKEYFIGQIAAMRRTMESHPRIKIFYVSLHFIENVALADIPLSDMAFTSYS